MMLLNTPEVEVGWQAAGFSLPDANGDIHHLSDLMGEQGLVVAFICNHCPYVQAIADRLADDARTLEGEGIHLVGINSNDFHAVPDDAPPRMLEFADKHGFDFLYLVDEDQTTGQAYGAVCTPDFFGFDANGVLRYRGRLDDAKMGDASGRTPELVDAMRIVARGDVPSPQYPSMGCSIKWRRS